MQTPEIMMKSINDRAVVLLALLQNSNKQAIHMRSIQFALGQQALDSLDNCIAIYNEYVTKQSPILDLIKANRFELARVLEKL